MGRPPKKARVASLHDDTYQRFVQSLVQRRKASKKSQQVVADALDWNQSIIAKIETAQRRIDVIELIRLSDVVGFDVIKLVREARNTMIREGKIRG
jgi:transcriptional regulator with XRE-family HTH domain